MLINLLKLTPKLCLLVFDLLENIYNFYYLSAHIHVNIHTYIHTCKHANMQTLTHVLDRQTYT